jgi:hypothetical protein
MSDPRAGMNQVEIVDLGTTDLLREVYHAAKRLREPDNLTRTMIIRDSRRQSEALLDLAISNYEESL